MKDKETELDEFLMSLGERIKKLRILKGLSREELSEISGVHKTQIYTIEHKASDPRASTLKALTTALESNADYVLFEEGEIGPTDEFRWLFEQLKIATPKRQEMVKEYLKMVIKEDQQEKIAKL